MSRIFAGILGVLVFLAVSLCVRAEPPHKLYMLNCMGCHGSKGQGVKGVSPSLIGIGNFLKVPGGRAYLIKAPDVRQSALTDAQVAAVMNWVLENFSRKSLPGKFAPYTPSEVHGYRAAPLPEFARTRKRLLREIASQKSAH